MGRPSCGKYLFTLNVFLFRLPANLVPKVDFDNAWTRDFFGLGLVWYFCVWHFDKNQPSVSCFSN